MNASQHFLLIKPLASLPALAERILQFTNDQAMFLMPRRLKCPFAAVLRARKPRRLADVGSSIPTWKRLKPTELMEEKAQQNERRALSLGGRRPSAHQQRGIGHWG